MPAEPTYTYSFNPQTDNKDAVRAMLMDTNPDGKGWMLSDEELLWAITVEGNLFLAGARAAEMIAAMFTGPKRNITTLRIGDLMKQSGARGGAAEDWHAVAAALRRRARRAAVPVAGGIDRDDRQERSDPNTIQPQFVRGVYDFLPNDRNDLGGSDPPRLP